MATVYLREFPEDLHRKAKSEAALTGISLKELIIRALTEYLKKKGGQYMGILAECPGCHAKQAVKNKACNCGEDLDKAKKAKRVKYWISYRLPNGKQRRESVDSFDDLNGYSIEDARKAESKRVVQRAEKRILDIKKEDRMTFNQLAEWYLGLEKVKNLASYWRIELALNKFNSVFGNDLVSSIQPADLENYQARRKAEGLADATIDQEIGAAKSLIYKAFDNDMISGEILKKFKRIRKLLKAGSNKRDKVVSVQQAYELMENCNAFLKPIVATAVGGTPEAIRHEQTGLLIPPKDENALAQSLIRLLRHPDMASQLGRNARQYAGEHFSMDRMIHELESLYQTLLRKKRGL